MNDVDDELRRALRREEPPAGFAERVLQRVSATPPKAAKADRRMPSRFAAPLRWATAATLAAAVSGGLWYRGVEERRRIERQQGEEARRQVLMVLEIAGAKLHAVEMRVNRGEER